MDTTQVFIQSKLDNFFVIIRLVAVSWSDAFLFTSFYLLLSNHYV